MGWVLVVSPWGLHNQLKNYTESHLTIFYSQTKINWILQTFLWPTLSMKEQNEGEQWKRSQACRTQQKGRRCLIYWWRDTQQLHSSTKVSREPRKPDKTTGAQLPAAQYRNWRPSVHRQKGYCQNCHIITSSSKIIFWLSLFFFLLNNWSLFCSKANKQTNPYRQYILEISAVSLLCSSLFQYHIMKSPHYILKKTYSNNKT